MKKSIQHVFFLPVLIAGLGLILARPARAQVYTFTGGIDQGLPQAPLLVSGNTLYGTTYGTEGGSLGNGTVYKVNTDGTGFTNLYSFTTGSYEEGFYVNGDGANPQAGLILAGNTLYGTAANGGSGGSGTVFAIHTDGTGFTNLYSFTERDDDFNNGDGASPQAGLVLSGNTLYGTTVAGGSSGNGVVFAIHTDGTGFTNLYGFSGGSDGGDPQCALVLSGNTLYGTTTTGGNSGNGVVFAINTDGTGFTNLYSFSGGSDGGNPTAGLVLSGNTLYGTAIEGGIPSTVLGYTGDGVVFAINTDGTGFTNLYSFTPASGSAPYGNSDGANPQAGLFLSGNTLYGTAIEGGSGGNGVVFAINADGTGFTNLYSFTGGGDGADPEAGLILSSNMLYGTANSGGAENEGTLFALSLPGAVVSSVFGYTINAGTVTITNYTGPGGALTIPITINNILNGPPVSNIGDEAFENQANITGVTIPGSVTDIGASAFSGCTSLSYAVINGSVTNIGDEAFNGCLNLTGVYFLGTAPTADDDVFAFDTNVTAYFLADAIGWTNLFAGVPAVLLPYTYTTSAGAITITGYTGPGGELAVPSTINGLPVTSIGGNAFYNSSLTTVTVPIGVTSIGYFAFENSSLTSITIPFGVTGIPEGMFWGCGNLTNVTLPNGVTSIGEYAFVDCGSLATLTLPDTLTSIGFSAFSDAGLNNIVLPNGVTSIGDSAFNYCTSLTSINLPNGITSLGMGMFNNCISLTSITIPGSVTSIDEIALAQCYNLKSVYFQGNAPSVQSEAFSFSSQATIYYLADTSGWTNPFYGVPAVLWNPEPQTSCGSFGALTNQFGFNIAGTSNLVVVVEACTNLNRPVWQPLQTNTLVNGSAYFSDPQWTNYPGRFYRLSSP